MGLICMTLVRPKARISDKNNQHAVIYLGRNDSPVVLHAHAEGSAEASACGRQYFTIHAHVRCRSIDVSGPFFRPTAGYTVVRCSNPRPAARCASKHPGRPIRHLAAHTRQRCDLSLRNIIEATLLPAANNEVVVPCTAILGR